MVLSGTVTNPDGVPLAGAHLQIAYQGNTNEYLGLETDANGRYEVAFDAIPNGYDGWLAFVSVWKDWLTTYEIHNQLIAVETQRATYDVRLRSAEWILANQSALLPESVDVTVRADDPVCYNDAQTLGWGMEWMVCHPLRLIAPSTGMLRIEMVPIGPVTTKVGLEFGIIGAGSAHCCGAGGVRFLRVSAGDLVVLNPQVSLGGTQSFRIFLTMQMDSPRTSGWPAPQR